MTSFAGLLPLPLSEYTPADAARDYLKEASLPAGGPTTGAMDLGSGKPPVSPVPPAPPQPTPELPKPAAPASVGYDPTTRATVPAAAPAPAPDTVAYDPQTHMAPKPPTSPPTSPPPIAASFEALHKRNDEVGVYPHGKNPNALPEDPAKWSTSPEYGRRAQALSRDYEEAAPEHRRAVIEGLSEQHRQSLLDWHAKDLQNTNAGLQARGLPPMAEPAMVKDLSRAHYGDENAHARLQQSGGTDDDAHHLWHTYLDQLYQQKVDPNVEQQIPMRLREAARSFDAVRDRTERNNADIALEGAKNLSPYEFKLYRAQQLRDEAAKRQYTPEEAEARKKQVMTSFALGTNLRAPIQVSPTNYTINAPRSEYGFPVAPSTPEGMQAWDKAFGDKSVDEHLNVKTEMAPWSRRLGDAFTSSYDRVRGTHGPFAAKLPEALGGATVTPFDALGVLAPVSAGAKALAGGAGSMAVGAGVGGAVGAQTASKYFEKTNPYLSAGLGLASPFIGSGLTRVLGGAGQATGQAATAANNATKLVPQVAGSGTTMAGQAAKTMPGLLPQAAPSAVSATSGAAPAAAEAAAQAPGMLGRLVGGAQNMIGGLSKYTTPTYALENAMKGAPAWARVPTWAASVASRAATGEGSWRAGTGVLSGQNVLGNTLKLTGYAAAPAAAGVMASKIRNPSAPVDASGLPTGQLDLFASAARWPLGIAHTADRVYQGATGNSSLLGGLPQWAQAQKGHEDLGQTALTNLSNFGTVAGHGVTALADPVARQKFVNAWNDTTAAVSKRIGDMVGHNAQVAGLQGVDADAAKSPEISAKLDAVDKQIADLHDPWSRQPRPGAAQQLADLQRQRTELADQAHQFDMKANGTVYASKIQGAKEMAAQATAQLSDPNVDPTQKANAQRALTDANRQLSQLAQLHTAPSQREMFERMQQNLALMSRPDIPEAIREQAGASYAKDHAQYQALKAQHPLPDQLPKFSSPDEIASNNNFQNVADQVDNFTPDFHPGDSAAAPHRPGTDAPYQSPGGGFFAGDTTAAQAQSMIADHFNEKYKPGPDGQPIRADGQPMTPQDTQHVRQLQALHQALPQAEAKIQAAVAKMSPEGLQQQLADPSSPIAAAGKAQIAQAPEVKKELANVAPQDQQKVVDDFWSKMPPNARMMLYGGLGLSLISLLFGLFGGGGEGGASSWLAPAAGLGGLALAGYGATGGDWSKLTSGQHWSDLGGAVSKDFRGLLPH